MLTCVPKPQDDDRIALNFIAEFVVTDEQATDLARDEVPQACTEAWIVAQQSRRGRPKGPHGAARGPPVHRREELVKSGKVGQVGPRLGSP